MNNLGTVIEISQLFGGLIHKMFKVTTTKGIFAIKKLNNEVITRKNAYNNFIESEKNSNLAKNHGIPCANALNIKGNYIIELESEYYIIFEYIEGKMLKDEEITLEHCKKIGKILADIHCLKPLESLKKEENLFIEWKEYIKNNNFCQMEYKNLYLKNYDKYYSILRRIVERYNKSTEKVTICHNDLDPKNVLWNNGMPIIIDWEASSLENPYKELIEVALYWSGFSSSKFDISKFKIIIEEYSKINDCDEVNWYFVICGNLIERFKWLDYNLKRSLKIIAVTSEEKNIAEKEVSNTINDINRYLELIGTIYEILTNKFNKNIKNYDRIIEEIIKNNSVLKNKKYKRVSQGFTNTIYFIENYVVRICTDETNEERFKNEIEFLKKYKHLNNISKLYNSDFSKSKVPYYYEVIEKVNGKTLYEVWYKLNTQEKDKIIIKIISILEKIHGLPVEEYDFNLFIKNKISTLLEECNLEKEKFNELFKQCDICFKENKFGLIHGDLHFDNFVYDNENLILLDFERCVTAPIDYDFVIFLRYNETPWLWASEKTDLLTVETDYQDFMTKIIKKYENLRKIPYLKQRFQIYLIIELLKDYKNTNNSKILEKIKLKIIENKSFLY